MTAYLAVLGHPDGLAWVLSREQMAFTSGAARNASQLARGDQLFYYLTNDCLGALGIRGSKSGLVVGAAVVLTDVRPLKEAVLIGGRRFSVGCELLFESLCPRGAGVSLRSLGSRLELIAGTQHWGQLLRRPPVRLSDGDAALIAVELAKLPTAFEKARLTYVPEATPV